MCTEKQNQHNFLKAQGLNASESLLKYFCLVLYCVHKCFFPRTSKRYIQTFEIVNATKAHYIAKGFGSLL